MILVIVKVFISLALQRFIPITLTSVVFLLLSRLFDELDKLLILHELVDRRIVIKDGPGALAEIDA